MTASVDVRTVRVQMVGGSTAILEVGGLRFITDPTFDPPGARENERPYRLTAPALQVSDVGHVDVALVSHDQHPDNLDWTGRELLADVPLVLTTVSGAERLGGRSRGLQPFEYVELDRSDGGRLRVTALPAQHGPQGAEAVSGPVVGFHLSADDLPSVYVSGDNASVDVVRNIVARIGEVEIAVLFAGAAKVPALFDGAALTLDSADAAEVARILGSRAVVPVHCEGWTHYTEGNTALVDAFASAGIADVLVVIAAGESVEL